jgi:hypothetical protein
MRQLAQARYSSFRRRRQPDEKRRAAYPRSWLAREQASRARRCSLPPWTTCACRRRQRARRCSCGSAGVRAGAAGALGLRPNRACAARCPNARIHAEAEPGSLDPWLFTISRDSQSARSSSVSQPELGSFRDGRPALAAMLSREHNGGALRPIRRCPFSNIAVCRRRTRLQAGPGALEPNPVSLKRREERFADGGRVQLLVDDEPLQLESEGLTDERCVTVNGQERCRRAIQTNNVEVDTAASCTSWTAPTRGCTS